MLRLYSIFFLCFVSLPLSACTFFAPPEQSMQEVLPAPVPTSFAALLLFDAEYSAAMQGGDTQYAERAPQPWWTEFNSTSLERLEAQALQGNFDILRAWSRVHQREALAEKAGASFFPSLGLNGKAAHNRGESKAKENMPTVESVGEKYSLGASASYELDLWGRVASNAHSAEFALAASREDMHGATMSVAASVAELWAQILALQAERAVLDKQIETNTALVRLQNERFSNGLSSALDVLQQRELLASTKADLPTLEQNLASARAQLAVLLGRMPSANTLFDEHEALPTVQTLPALGLPVQVLAHRPDIASSWAALQKAGWDVSAARAQRFPQLTLSASGVYEAASTSLLFSNWLTQLAAGLTYPLFDGGKLAADEAYARALANEALHNYSKTVALAFQESVNALAASQASSQRLAQLEKQFALSSVATKGSLTSYLNGRDDFLRFVSQLQKQQQLERTVVRQKLACVQSRIALYRALGLLHFPDEFFLSAQSAGTTFRTEKDS